MGERSETLFRPNSLNALMERERTVPWEQRRDDAKGAIR